MAVAAVRSLLRSPSVRCAAPRVAAGSGTGAGASRPSLLRHSTLRPSTAARFLRSPAETSFCVESLMPMHSATASALMTSMLSVSSRNYGWLSEGQDETR